ncbi:hypothetical protein D3C77_657010 [compost metagenome]
MTCSNIIFINKKDWVSIPTCFRTQHEDLLCLLAVGLCRTMLYLGNPVNNRRSLFTHNGTRNHLTIRAFTEVNGFRRIVHLLGTGADRDNLGIGGRAVTFQHG